MKLRNVLVTLTISLAPLALAPAASAAVRAASAPAAASDQNPSSECSAAFFQDDRRLGPLQIARTGAVGLELRGYERTGGMPVSQFLATFWDPTANSGSGGFIFPPDNGYVIGPDGNPIVFVLTLQPGSDMDRFGSEFGRFLSPAGSSYASRSIPPQNLDSIPAASCNYHDYQVLKTFSVDAGPIAPWFGQPGLGTQYQLDPTLIPGAPATINVMWLLNNGYIERITP